VFFFWNGKKKGLLLSPASFFLLNLLKKKNRTRNFFQQHNFTSMVGAGILALPFAMACLGWPFGITCMLLSWAIR